jgi:hypothetical protein
MRTAKLFSTFDPVGATLPHFDLALKSGGLYLGEFVCRNFSPLILIRDNIAKNRGGALM